MAKTPTNPLANRRAVDWFQFFVPALLMTAMFVHFLPSFVVAGIAVLCMAANGYAITRKPALFRQIVSMVWLIGGTALALYVLENSALEAAKPLAIVISYLAVAGVLIGLLSTLWHFATSNEASPTE
jgi:hypothetical protein